MTFEKIDPTKLILGLMTMLLAGNAGYDKYSAYRESQVVRPAINAVDIEAITESNYFKLYMEKEIAIAIEAKETASAEENTTSLRYLAHIHGGVPAAEVPIYIGKLIKFHRALVSMKIDGGLLAWIKRRTTWVMAGPVKNKYSGEVRYDLYGSSLEAIEMRKHIDATMTKYMYRREGGAFVPCD